MVNLKAKNVSSLLSCADHCSAEIIKSNYSKIDCTLKYKLYLVKPKILMHPLS